MIVEVYRNLRNGQWSIRHAKTKRVVAYATEVALCDCSLVVNQSGRQSVLDSGRKNVHAYIRGTYVGGSITRITTMFDDVDDGFPFDGPPYVITDGWQVTYDPFTYATFVYKNDKTPVHRAHWVEMTQSSTVWVQ